MKVRRNHYRVHFADGRMLELINCATLVDARWPQENHRSRRHGQRGRIVRDGSHSNFNRVFFAMRIAKSILDRRTVWIRNRPDWTSSPKTSWLSHARAVDLRAAKTKLRAIRAKELRSKACANCARR